jgi:uncharacterized protein YrrD
MVETGNVYPVDSFVGRAVLSRASANTLGQLHDFIVNPIEGGLAGIAVKMVDGSLGYVEYSEIYSIGPDAVMVNNDRSALPTESSPLNVLQLALNKLVGAEVITESGKTLGHIANVFMHLAEEPVLIYEARSSLLDKLLRRTLFFPASFGRAFSEGDARLVVVEDTAEKADGTLDALVNRMFGPPKGDDPVVVIRSRGY